MFIKLFEKAYFHLSVVYLFKIVNVKGETYPAVGPHCKAERKRMHMKNQLISLERDWNDVFQNVAKYRRNEMRISDNLGSHFYCGTHDIHSLVHYF